MYWLHLDVFSAMLNLHSVCKCNCTWNLKPVRQPHTLIPKNKTTKFNVYSLEQMISMNHNRSVFK